MSAAEKVVSRVCPECGRVLEETWSSCPYCSKDLTGTKSAGAGRSWGVLSIIFGAVSLIIFGIPLGLAAIVCGAIAVAKKEDKLGIVGIILGVIGAVLAVWLLFMIF